MNGDRGETIAHGYGGFGPWATTLDTRGGAELNTFWQRRMAMLATMKSTRSRVSRTLWIVLAALALAVLAVPLVYLSRADGAASEEPKIEFFPAPTPSETRILAALEEPTVCEFNATPLQDAVSFLMDKHGIPIQLNSRALEDVGLGSDTPVSCHVNNISLASALSLLLRDGDLTWLIQDEVLLITTKDKAEGPDGNFPRTYPVGDLVEKDNYETLVKVIKTTVANQTWNEVGGPGMISAVPSSRSIVISQTRDVHDAILELLRALRAARNVN
jgi:hypothetical protein